MFVYVQKCTYTVNKIVRIREQELFVYVNSLFVYVNLGSNTSQFAPLQTCVYAKICASTMCLYVEKLYVYKAPLRQILLLYECAST